MINNNTSHKLEDEVKQIIATMTGLKSDKINPDSHMYNDLGIDSIKAIELVVAVQEKYGIRVSDSKIAQLTTVKLVTEEILRLLAKKQK